MLRALDVSTGGGGPTPGNFTTLDVSGNITASGNAQRFFADLNSTPLGNRFYFVTRNSNQSSQVGVLPNGIANSSSFAAFNKNDPDNASYIFWAVGPTTSSIVSGALGTGTVLPLSISVGNTLIATANSAGFLLNSDLTFSNSLKLIGNWQIDATAPFFQNTGFNDTFVGTMPGPGGGQSSGYAVLSETAVANSSFGQFIITRNGSVSFNSSKNGSASVLPIDFKMDFNVTARITTAGKWLFNTGTPTAGNEAVQINGALSINDAVLIRTYTAFTNGAGAGAGTLTNAPAAGNPTKWIPVNDNGTTRYIPAW